MKRIISKTLRILGGVVVGLLLLLAGYMYWTWPIYPAGEKQMESFAALRETLNECEATKDCVVLDPADFGADTKSFTLEVSSRFRNAEPCGYSIFGTYPETDRKRSLSIFCLPLDDFLRLEVDESVYRGVQTKISSGSYPSQERYMELKMLCGEYYYSVCVSFAAPDVSQQELAELETDMQALVYSIADRIIDAAAP